MKSIGVLAIVGFAGLASVHAANPGMSFDGKHFEWPRLATPRDAYYSNNITRQIETPHLKAAVPYARGRIKVLFIVPRSSVRPIVELCQRFDVKERYALIYSGGRLGHPPPRFHLLRPRCGTRRSP